MITQVVFFCGAGCLGARVSLSITQPNIAFHLKALDRLAFADSVPWHYSGRDVHALSTRSASRVFSGPVHLFLAFPASYRFPPGTYMIPTLSRP
jgi:hypothetical protein